MTNNEKRLLAVTGTFFMVAVVAVLTAVPYVRKWQFYDKTIAERQTRIHNYKRQIANKTPLMDEIALVDEIMSSSDLFLRAKDKATASSTLLDSVKKMVEKAGGQIRSINILDNRRQRTARNVVAVKLNFNINNKGFVTILKGLADSKPLLNVTSARLNPVLKRQGRARVDTGQVRIDLVVEAFYTAGGQE